MAVNRRHDIELNGRGLMVKHGTYKKASENIYVSPRDLKTSEGETPLSSFWWQKRFSDFSGGGGQKYAESKNAQENRIIDSQDMDFSTPGEAKLMKAMAASLSKTGTNGKLFTALGYLWLVDGTDLYYYNGTAWSAAVATGVTGNIACITDDGQYLYAAGTSGGVWYGTTGAWSNWTTNTTPTALAYINKSLYGANGTSFGKMVQGGSATEIYNAGTGWTINWIAGHNQKIAFGGHKGSAGDERSFVWESDGTASGTTLLVDDLPDGYKGYGGLSYLDVLYIWGGYELVGGTTAAGVLYAYTNGALTIGGHFKEAADMGNPGRQSVPTLDTIPRCALADGQFVYFGMNERTGLWRYDLKEGGLHRSWSAATTNNLVTGVATYKGKTYLAYSGAGAFVEQTTYQSSGWLKLSATTMGSSNRKLGRRLFIAYHGAGPTVSYQADALPANASPAWTKVTAGSPTEAVSGGVLTTTGTGTSKQDYSLADSNLNNAIGTTVEARIKVASSDSPDTHLNTYFWVDDGAHILELVLWTNKIAFYPTLVINQNDYYMDTTNTYHTYRITLKGQTGKLYVDGTLIMTIAVGNSSTTKEVRFGDRTTLACAHTEYWDYIRYWRTGAFAPGEESTPASNPFAVEVADDNSLYVPLNISDSAYKEYDLYSGLSQWDTLYPKITLSDSNVTIGAVTIETVPTLPNTNYWEMVVPLSDELAILGDNEPELINAQEVYEALVTARDNKIPVTFKEMDYDMQATQVTRKVLIETLEQHGPYYDIEENKLVNCEMKLKLREF